MTSNLKTCVPVGVRCPIDLFSHHRIFGNHFLSTFGHQERRWPYVGFPGISLELFYHHQAKMRILLQTGLRWLSLQLVVGFSHIVYCSSRSFKGISGMWFVSTRPELIKSVPSFVKYVYLRGERC